jgi:type IV fimbrial biogenesis protein FimT
MGLFAKSGYNSPPIRAGAYRRGGGFTLVELMVVLVIVAVLLIIALPSFSVLTLRTKLKSYANEVVSSVYLARSEAIKRNAPMTMCIAKEPYDGTCAGAGNEWDQGWIVMDPNDLVIKRQQTIASGVKVFGLSSLHTMTFQPTGVTMANTAQKILTICQQSPSVGIEERKVTVSATGKPRIQTTNAGCP